MNRFLKRPSSLTALTVLLPMMILMLALISPASAQVIEFNDITYAAAGTPTTEYDAVQMPAEAGKPVQWVKEIKSHNAYDLAVSEIGVHVPVDAEDIKISCIMTGSEYAFERDGDTIRFRDTLAFDEKRSYAIRYTTPPPELRETTLVQSADGISKNVIVSSDNHYLDVLTYAAIPGIEPEDSGDVRLYWYIGGVKTDVTADPEFDLHFYDTDDDGLYDRMSWVTPHLSTQIFEIVISSQGDGGSYSRIGIDLLAPADDAYIYSTSLVTFNYSVQFNSSTTVLCNLSVDGSVWEQDVPASGYNRITNYHNLSSGTHSWSVLCTGDDGAVNTSETRAFTIDLDAPSVTLSTPDYHVSNTDSIQLNFTAVDAEDPTLDCDVTVNGALNQTGITASTGVLKTVTLTGLSNGVYDWSVSCDDSVGNTGNSEERVFYISKGTPAEFNISPNKDEYSLGQTGYLIINAEPGSNLTLFVSRPNHDSFFRYYNDRTYPLIEMVNYTENVGTYSLDGIFTHLGNVYIVKTSFEVSNTFSVGIELNETTGQPADVFTFKAVSSGGIGSVTYEWDFDDGTTTTGNEVDHTFPNTGDYSVKVTATDGKGNRVSDTVDVRVYNKFNLNIVVKELQTQIVLEDVSVEVDDERKKTDSKGEVSFSVYEGKKRIYITKEGYEPIKQVRNISEDTTLTIDINNTAITNYTPPPQSEETSESVLAAEETANTEAELLVARIESAIADLEDADAAANAVIDALGIMDDLQNAKKELRQALRDIGNTELKDDLTEEEKLARIENITDTFEKYEDLISSVEVEDTTEFVDYPKSSDISMLAAEYLNYKGIEYSKREKADYIALNAELQSEVAITTRLSVVELTLLSGATKTISLVVNTISKKPTSTDGRFFLEYIPKEVAEHSDDVTSLTESEVVKSDPILRFDAGVDEYSYYIGKSTSIDNLKKTKHVLFMEPEGAAAEGMSSVTGFTFLPSVNIENPKLALQIALIVLLLVAYLAYHFELIDKVRDWRKKRQGIKDPLNAPYETDMAYQPESTLSIMTGKIQAFIDREDRMLREELAHIRILLQAVHHHSDNGQHEEAETKYTHVKSKYIELSPDAKARIHPETKQAYSKLVLAKINRMLTEAGVYLENDQHHKAKNHYSEIKKLYQNLEKEHRAAVSAKCVQLHEKLFSASLT